MASSFLGIDVGGTKIAWGSFDTSLKLTERGRLDTPETLDLFVAALVELITANESTVVGMGLPGTHTKDGKQLITCPNVPYLSGVALPELLQEQLPDCTVVMDNDARCAMIAEVAAGAAKNDQNALLITLGTGVGGAVMQRGQILIHPEDINQEVGHVVVDSTDAFVSPTSGRGTVEAFLGGRNLELRLGVSLQSLAKGVRIGNGDASAVWEQIQTYMRQCIEAIHATYTCRKIIVAGRGVADLEYYLGEYQPPCPVVPATLGEDAGLYGAAQLAYDRWKDGKSNDLWV